MKIKNIFVIIGLLFFSGCGGTILDDTALDTKNIQIQGISISSASTNASIIWTTDIPATHHIEYGTESGNYTQSSVETADETTTHQVDISDLVTDETYYYRIVCNSGGFETVQSAEYSFTTSSSINVTFLTAGSLTTNSAVISWTTNVPATHIIEYGVTAGVYTKSTIQSSSPDTSHSVTLSGLASGTEYFYQVKNFHSTLPYSASAELSFITTGVITVSGITESSSTSSITIEWNTNLPTTHSIDYGTVSGTLSSSTTPSVAASTSHSVTISGLAKGKVYYYQINNTHATLGTVSSSERSCSTTPTLAQKLRGIWIVGGLSSKLINSTNTVSQVDLYDPVTGLWYANITTLPTAVSFMGVASLGGKIYVIGGFDNGGNVRADIQAYTVSTDSWANPIPASLPLPRVNIEAAVVNGKIYIIQGNGVGGGSATTTWAGTQTVYEFTPPSTVISKIATYPGTNLSNRSLAVYNDSVYSIGGRSSATAGITTVNNYVTSYSTTGAETTVVEIVLNPARVGNSTVIFETTNGPAKMLTIGGITTLTGAPATYVYNSTGAGTSLDTVHYLPYPFIAPYTAWSPATSLPGTIGKAFGSAVVSGDYVYYFGGATSTPTATGDVYSLNCNALASSWNTLTSMPVVRFGHAAVTINQ